MLVRAPTFFVLATTLVPALLGAEGSVARVGLTAPPSVQGRAGVTAPTKSARVVELDRPRRWSPVPRSCTVVSSHTASGFRSSRLRACPAEIVAQALAWQPDALVAVGGGILANGEPGCPSEQRAFAAMEIFERLGRTPTVVLTGAGPSRPARALTSSARRCALARRERERDAPRTRAAERRRLSAEIAVLAHAEAASLTEAEYMCAAALDSYPAAEREAVLEHLVLEARATSTAQNALFAAPLLRAHGARRVLAISTPVYRRGGSVREQHARRVAQSFRAYRTGAEPYRVGAIACPYGTGGPGWAEFEPEPSR